MAFFTVSISYEGETFVTRDELKKLRTMRQFACKNRITAFLFIKTETQMSKREKPKTAVDTKTEKQGILSAKTEKTISKVTKTTKPKKPDFPLHNVHNTRLPFRPQAAQAHASRKRGIY